MSTVKNISLTDMTRVVNNRKPTENVFPTPGLVLGAATDLQFADPLTEMVNMTVLRYHDVRAAHWEVYFEDANGGNSTKVDLLATGYRILYGAAFRLPTVGKPTEEKFKLNPPPTLGYVYKAVACIAACRPKWKGSDDTEIKDQYNCQDFAIMLMTMVGVPRDRLYPYRLRRMITKECTSLELEDKSNVKDADLADWVWL